jgi:aminopeptidase N
VAFIGASSGLGAPAPKPAPSPKLHPRPYGRGAARFHPTPVPPYAIVNEDVLLSFDVPKGAIHAQATITVRNTSGAPHLVFDSVGLQYESVTVAGTRAGYRTDGTHVIVDVPPGATPETPLTVVAIYHATPVRGIYFVRPKAAEPARDPEIWTQGETEDTRRWMPTWDEPNMKFTTSIAAIVPTNWTVISNGGLVSDLPYAAYSAGSASSAPVLADGTPATHLVSWREDRPHSSYLTSFVAGPYTKTHDALGPLDVDAYTHAADAPFAQQCFGKTPQMIAFFQKITGTPYPWEKYAQTTVQEFTAGGMENVSATTQTEFAIHPPEFEREAPCDGLVSHELAHQWFGDDVTTVDWPNIWLNEGFATYFQELWTENAFGPNDFAYERVHAQDAYFRETRRYWRPIVDYTYGDANDPFDASGYPRPAQVLHMLRTLLGDETFSAVMKNYLAAHAYQNVDTRMFEAAVEQTTGKNWKWFFDEWFYTASHPNYVVTEHYDAPTGALTLEVTQKNHGGALFRMPVTIAVTPAGGTVHETTSVIAAARQTVTLGRYHERPVMVLFDAGNNVLRTLDMPKPVAELAYQAAHAPSVADRLWAIRQLAHAGPADRTAARAAVAAAVGHDPFYGVRVDALDAAASLDGAAIVQAALADPDPRVVIAAARETSSLTKPPAAFVAALRTLTTSDDMQIRAAALAGYGATKAPDAKGLLLAALETLAPLDVVARGALDGLGDLADPSTLDAIVARSVYGRPERTRVAAIGALGKMLSVKSVATKAETVLLGYATSDPYFRARSASVGALAKGGRKDALATLAKIERTDSEPGVRSAAYDAIADINDPPGPPQK